MILQDYKKDYIITLVDASENEIKNSICMEGFAHHQFLMVDKSGYAISQETKETPFSAGDVIYVAAGRRVGLRCEGSMRIRHIAFSGRNIRPLLHYCRFGEFCITSATEKSDINAMFDEIFNMQADRGEDKYMNLSVSLYTLLSRLGEINIEKSAAAHESKQLILRPVIDYMREIYRSSVMPYKDIADSLGMTEKEVDTLFITEYSMTGAEFFKKLRMENAKHLLFFYADSGAEYVAVNMGYESAAQLEADFFAQFGMTTDEFVRLYWDKG